MYGFEQNVLNEEIKGHPNENPEAKCRGGYSPTPGAHARGLTSGHTAVRRRRVTAPLVGCCLRSPPAGYCYP